MKRVTIDVRRGRDRLVQIVEELRDEAAKIEALIPEVGSLTRRRSTRKVKPFAVLDIYSASEYYGSSEPIRGTMAVRMVEAISEENDQRSYEVRLAGAGIMICPEVVPDTPENRAAMEDILDKQHAFAKAEYGMQQMSIRPK